jgi:hypothetical protein
VNAEVLVVPGIGKIDGKVDKYQAVYGSNVYDTAKTLESIGFRGWAHDPAAIPAAFGYIVNDGEPVWDDSFLVEDPSLYTALSSQTPRRYEIMIPTADLAEGIYAINVSEVENLFLDETFLKGMAEWFHIEDCDNVIEQIKDDIKKDFSQSIEQQIANYVSAKIDYIFKEENVEKANKKADVSIKFNSFCEKIKIDEWIAEREEYLNSITNDYNEIIKVYNNKGLKRHVNKGFNIPDFPQRAFNYLKNNVEAQNVIKTYFPSALDT